MSEYWHLAPASTFISLRSPGASSASSELWPRKEPTAVHDSSPSPSPSLSFSGSAAAALAAFSAALAFSAASASCAVSDIRRWRPLTRVVRPLSPASSSSPTAIISFSFSLIIICGTGSAGMR